MTLLVRSIQGCATSSNVSPHVRKSKTVLDSGFHAVDSGFQVVNPNSLSVEQFKFQIPIVSGIPDSLSCIPDSKAQNSRFHGKNFPGFWNPHSLTWGEMSFTWYKTAMLESTTRTGTRQKSSHYLKWLFPLRFFSHYVFSVAVSYHVKH